MAKYEPNRTTRRDIEDRRLCDAQSERKAHAATIEAAENIKSIDEHIKSLEISIGNEQKERMVEDRKVKRSARGWNIFAIGIAVLALALDVLQNWEAIASFFKTLFK